MLGSPGETGFDYVPGIAAGHDGRLRGGLRSSSGGSRREHGSQSRHVARRARVRGLRARGRGRHLVRRASCSTTSPPARATSSSSRPASSHVAANYGDTEAVALLARSDASVCRRASSRYPTLRARSRTSSSLRHAVIARIPADGRRDQRVRALHQRRDGRGLLVPRSRRAGVRRGARHRAARGRARDRPRRRGRARRARRRLGQDARERALPPPARARRRDRREPQGALGARVAERRQGDLLDEGRALRRRRELPLLRLRDRLDRRPLQSDRRLAALVHAEGAGRRRRPDRAVELPAADDDVEARARARRRLRRRPEARSADAGDGAAPRRARGRGRLPGRRDQHRHRRRADDRRVSRQASGRRQGRVHRLDEDGRRDHAALLRADQAADARARRQEPQPRLRGRRPGLGDPERGLVDLLLRRPELRGALPGPRRAGDLRRLRRTRSASRPAG